MDTQEVNPHIAAAFKYLTDGRDEHTRQIEKLDTLVRTQGDMITELRIQVAKSNSSYQTILIVVTLVIALVSAAGSFLGGG